MFVRRFLKIILFVTAWHGSRANEILASEQRVEEDCVTWVAILLC